VAKDRDLVIAIDGPAGAGKSTVARGLARALGFVLIDTGALYRAIAWLAKREGLDWDAGPKLSQVVNAHDFEFTKEGQLLIDGDPVEEEIRTTEISEGASKVAGHQEVRDALLDVQRTLGSSGGVVMEGRDIGTTVFPDAKYKFFLTASAKTRAKRRYLEMLSRGEKTTLATVEENQEERDVRDINRVVSPLKKAEDAIEINCDGLTIEETIEKLLMYV
jgi:cytidylate kinase